MFHYTCWTPQISFRDAVNLPKVCSWWQTCCAICVRNYMMTSSNGKILAFCAWNSPITGEFPLQRPVTWSFDIFFDLSLNKRLSKQSWGLWFETRSRSWWRHCNEMTSTTQRRCKAAIWITQAIFPGWGMFFENKLQWKHDYSIYYFLHRWSSSTPTKSAVTACWLTWRLPPCHSTPRTVASSRQPGTALLRYMYRQFSNIRRTKSQNLKDSRTVLRLSLPNPLKPDVKSRMKM